ncbi:MAG: biotin--[acetyl-CoA-carboxylase] ligase [Chloroflexi bacterium]|nr:biotin--[acetyl-CoA-carboxylase] ligase [Chloroflexota bacterium]
MPESSEFTLANLERTLAGLRFGRPLRFFESIGSTNDEARRMAEGGAPEGALVVADEQVTGRGRAGRSWQTPRGAALAASFILRPDLAPAQLGRITMLGGLAAAEAIDKIIGGRASLKWPNDVLLDHKKVCGVLAESALIGERIAFVVLGIGINVNAGPAGEVQFPATSLAEASGGPVDRVALLASLARRLTLRYEEIGGESLHEAWAARLAYQGKRVTVNTSAGVTEGVDEDVDADGALILRLDSGESRRVLAGDVRLRPSSLSPSPPATLPGGEGSYRPIRFIGEAIEVEFDRPPLLEKKPGCPNRFTWRGASYQIVEKLSEWHEYGRRGRMAHNMQPEHAAVAEVRGSWGVGRDYFRVRSEGGQIFELYYDRAPKGSDRRKGEWFLVSELAQASH